MSARDMGHRVVKKAATAAAVCAATWLAAGCGDEAQPPRADKPTIAVTIHPIASLVEQLVGDAAEVVCLLPAGQSPHHAELTSNKRAALGRAGVIVAVGLGLDGWVESTRTTGGGATILRCGDLLDLAPADRAHERDHAHGDHDHGPAETTVDPHFWTDPVLARALVIKLADRLQQALPELASTIVSRREALVEELRTLDAAYRRRLAPFKGAALVTYHSAFNRLADRYGLAVAATLAPVETPGAMTVEARRRAETVIERHGLKVIFAEPQFPPAAAETIKRQMGVAVLTLDPLGDPHDPQRASYQAMMRYNLDQLVKGLGRNAEAAR